MRVDRTRSHGGAFTTAVEPEPVVVCSHVVKFYGGATSRVQAVRGVDIEVGAGVVAAVVGPSGSGKSSLLRMISGLDAPTAGVVTIGGTNLYALGPRARARRRSQLVTHVHQRPRDNLFAHLTVDQQLQRAGRRSDPDLIEEVLGALGLAAARTSTPAALSGGEQQRLALGRALLSSHPLIVADEPTSRLDAENATSVLDAIGEVAQRGVAVVIATHDPRVLERVDQVITLRDGAVSTVTDAGSELAVIDRSGRIQLPLDVQAQYPDRRARMRVDTETGHVELDPP